MEINLRDTVVRRRRGRRAPRWRRIRQAAEIYSMSELDRYFDEVAGLGEREKALAARMREMRRSHDVEGKLTLIEEGSRGD